MSPIPLIERQRALARIGEIRCGDEKTDGRVGRKLETFRLTSQQQEIIERAASLYGGTVKPWESPAGPAFQVVTTRSALPVMVIPGYSLKRSYERWSGPSKRDRLCDGVEEMLTGKPCLCNAAGIDECATHTRLMVLLPETGTSLGWQVSSRGETAADELAAAMEIAQGLAQGRTFVPAQLRLTQRKGQKDGKATRFVVPVLDFNPVAAVLAEGEIPAALPVGYTPIETNGEQTMSVAEGLEFARTQARRITGRSAQAIPAVPADIEFGSAPVPADPADLEGGAARPLETPRAPVEAAQTADAAASQVAEAGPPASAPLGANPNGSKPMTEAMKKKLNVLVGELRDDGHITTLQLWQAMGMAKDAPHDEDGTVHWSDLREMLTRDQGHELIDRLEALRVRVGA